MSDNEPQREMLLTLLKGAPGPAPWYVRNTDHGMTCGGRPLVWADADPDGPFHGDVVLDDEGKSLLFIRMHTVVGALPDNRLLVAFKRSHPDVLVLHLFNVDDFQAIDDPQVVCRVIENPDQPYCAAVEPVAEALIPRRIGPGDHPFHFPAAFSGIGEVVLVTHLMRCGGPDNAARSTAIIVLHPETHRIEVIPQTWFNEGPYQHGFQWITRAARDPISDRIVGEGIRLGYFVLDETGEQLEDWLVENKTHMP